MAGQDVRELGLRSLPAPDHVVIGELSDPNRHCKIVVTP
jgi:hypothetical protein